MAVCVHHKKQAVHIVRFQFQNPISFAFESFPYSATATYLYLFFRFENRPSLVIVYEFLNCLFIFCYICVNMENIPICRVCMQRSPEFVDFDMPLQNENEEDTNITYLDFFYECTRIEVELHELGSHCFCLPCGDELRSFHKFLKIAEMTDSILKDNLLATKTESRKSDPTIQINTWYTRSSAPTEKLLNIDELAGADLGRNGTSNPNCEANLYGQMADQQLVDLQVEIFKDKKTPSNESSDTNLKMVNTNKKNDENKHRRAVKKRKLYETSLNKDPIECAFCHDILKNRRTLNEHLIEEHQTRAQPCGICGKMVIRMREHLLIHYRQKNALSRPKTECPICFRIVSKQTIARHIQYVHKHEIKKQKCPQCCQTFADAHKLKVHLSKGHSTDAQLKCPLCYRTFSKMISLNNHLRIHPCLHKVE